RMDDLERPDLYLFTEDQESAALLLEIVRDAEIELSRLKIMEVGPSNMVEALGRLASQQRLPAQGIGVLDADQSIKPGCFRLPGAKPPEKQVIEDILNMAIPAVSTRLGVSEGSVQDALGSACCLPDHHDWIKHLSGTLKQSEQYLWTTLCQIWVRDCMPDADSAALVTEITSRLV
ncbi:MAG: hypothetical protein WCE61_15490, partial [Candidatus Acidiferrum sp.]